MGERVAAFLAGLMLIATMHKTLGNVFKYYFKPGTKLELNNIRFRKFWHIMDVLTIDLGISFMLLALIPVSQATNTLKLPTNGVNLFAYLVQGAIGEELLFRILPWYGIFCLRYFYNHRKWTEILNILAGVISSVTFGFLHITNFANPDIWLVIKLIPLSLGGLLYWYLLEQEGPDAPVLAHLAYNLLVILI